MDKQKLDEHMVLLAEIVISKIFEGRQKVATADVIAHCRESGLLRREIREARKRLGVQSWRDGSGTYWWYWPKEKDAADVNHEKSRQLMEEIGNERKRD